MFSRPSILLLENVPRRFGHAATDRQASYMTEEEIKYSADRDPLRGLVPSDRPTQFNF